MTDKSEERIDRVPLAEPRIGDETITIRLSGNWLTRWRSLMEGAGTASKVDVLRECLSLGFACASLDENGEPVRVILRRKNKNGEEMPEEDLVDFLGLRTVQAYRVSRQQDRKKRTSGGRSDS